jgi:hypothetical protein
MDNEQKLKKMLATDRLLYANIVKMKALIAERRKPITEYKAGSRNVFKNGTQANGYIKKFNALAQDYNSILKAYLDRQNDYRTNKLYSLGNKVTEYTDKATNYFKSLWNSVTDGLGALPLAVPIAIATGATISAIAIAYFVKSYYEKTLVDYNDSLKTIEQLAKVDPVLADKALDRLNEIQQEQQKAMSESGLFSNVGKGLKTGLTILSIGAAAGVGFYVYQNSNLK